MDNAISYVSLSFISNFDVTSFSILVENFEGDKEEKEEKDYYPNNILDVKYGTNYDLEFKKEEELYYVLLNSTQPHIGEQFMDLIVPHGTSFEENDCIIYGYMLKTDKIAEIIQITEQFYPQRIEVIEGETNDTYKYSFTLDEDKQYFLIIVALKSPLDKIKVNFHGINEEEKKDEEITATNLYNVTFSKEYEIDKKYLVASEKNFSFYLLSKEPYEGDTYVQFKLKKDASRKDLEIYAIGKKNIFDKNEESVYIVIEYKGSLDEDDEYDSHIFHFTLDEELNFLIYVRLKENFDYLSVYLSESNPKKKDLNFHIYDLALKSEFKIDKKNFPNEIIPENEQFIFKMENDG